MAGLREEISALDRRVLEQIANDAVYAHYVERQKEDVARLERDEGIVLPADLDYAAIEGLSAELRQKLSAARPETLAQAGRIDGMTPAALTLVLARVRRLQKRSA
jgi:tRNA uridine 5-carboxymethylaminomethyl modification enzyme